MYVQFAQSAEKSCVRGVIGFSLQLVEKLPVQKIPKMALKETTLKPSRYERKCNCRRKIEIYGHVLTSFTENTNLIRSRLIFIYDMHQNEKRVTRADCAKRKIVQIV